MCGHVVLTLHCSRRLLALQHIFVVNTAKLNRKVNSLASGDFQRDINASRRRSQTAIAPPSILV